MTDGAGRSGSPRSSSRATAKRRHGDPGVRHIPAALCTSIWVGIGSPRSSSRAAAKQRHGDPGVRHIPARAFAPRYGLESAARDRHPEPPRAAAWRSRCEAHSSPRFAPRYGLWNRQPEIVIASRRDAAAWRSRREAHSSRALHLDMGWNRQPEIVIASRRDAAAWRSRREAHSSPRFAPRYGLESAARDRHREPPRSGGMAIQA